MSKKSVLSHGGGEEEIFVDQVGLDFNHHNSPSHQTKQDEQGISPQEDEEEAKRTQEAFKLLA